MVNEKQETGLVKYQAGQMSIPDLRNLAMDFAKSGYFADAKEAAQAVVKIQAGIEMGFGPVYSMTKIYIVKGKVMVSAEALGAMVKRSGRYDYRVKSLTDTEAILEFTDHEKMVYASKFTMDDAKRADLVKGDSGWQKWPRAMLMSKAISQGARIVCPHVIAGVYTPADFGVETNEDGEPRVIVDSTSIVIKETPPVEMIIESQRKKIFATAKEKNYTEDQIKDYIWQKYAKPHTADLTKKEAGEIIDAIEKSELMKPPAGPEPQQETGEKTWKTGRDPNTIKNLNDLYKACCQEWPDSFKSSKDVVKELGYSNQMDIKESPSECYSKIASVRK